MAEMPIIDDNNYQQFTRNVPGRGYYGMWRTQERRATAPGFEALAGVPLIPESEWSDRIRQREKDHATLKEFALGIGLEVLNQASTNYCWINAPTFCCMVTRAKETQREIRLSPASGGARIKNFRNVGGWGSEALDWFIQHGLNEQSDWPANAIDRRYDTAENREKAKIHKVLEYYRLDSWAETVSCILSGVPVAVGYNWWSHEVTAMDLLLDGGLVIANSWGNWGDQGYGVLQGSKRYPNDAVAITAMMPL